MTAKEIQRNFKGVDLNGKCFAGENLEKADFTGANIRGANFTKATLNGAIFNQADIRGANFTNAKLKAASFVEAKAGLTPFWAISMSLLSLTLSVLCVVIFLFIFDHFWQNSSIPIAEIKVYFITFLIAFPVFIFLILRKGAAAALLSLAMTAIAAMLIIQVPSVAIAIVLILSLVIFPLFLILGWRTFAIIPIELILGSILWSLLVFCLDYLGESLPTYTYNTFVQSLGNALSITVTETLILAISVTTLGCIGVAIAGAVFMGVAIPVIPLTILVNRLLFEKLPVEKLILEKSIIEQLHIPMVMMFAVVLGILIVFGAFLGAYIVGVLCLKMRNMSYFTKLELLCQLLLNLPNFEMQI